MYVHANFYPTPHPTGNVYIGCDWDESWKDRCYDEDKSMVSSVEIMVFGTPILFFLSKCVWNNVCSDYKSHDTNNYNFKKAHTAPHCYHSSNFQVNEFTITEPSVFVYLHIKKAMRKLPLPVILVNYGDIVSYKTHSSFQGCLCSLRVYTLGLVLYLL